MIEILIPLFAFWFAELSELTDLLTGWLMSRSILYKEFNPIDNTSKVVFNQYSLLYKVPIRLYPFDCTKCLSFWLGGIYNYLMYDNLVLAVFIGGCSSLLGILASKLYSKL